MKIAHVEAVHLAIPSHYDGPQPRAAAQWPKVEMLLVRVATDDGLVGWGEGFGHAASTTTKAALESLVAPLCLGADATDPEGLNARVTRALHAYGPGGPVLFALSGVDIALWDIRGKVRAEPIHRLLGAELVRPRVPAYASLLRYGDPELVAAAVHEAVARGHRAVKLHEADPATVAAARAAAGSAVDLMLDVNGRWPLEQALAAAREVAPYELRWLEEPVWPLERGIVAQIATETRVPLAAGENVGSIAALAALADAGVSFLQPSAAKLGGLTALTRAAARLADGGVGLAPHSAYFGPALAATIHFCAAAGASCEWYGCRLEANPCGLAPVGGELEVPRGPGLGIDVDPAILTEYRVR